MSYQNYFDQQIGYGNYISPGIGRVFVGSANQRGHGIGKFLGGLFRKAMPLLSRGAKAVGREAWRAGLNVLSDVASSVPLKESVRVRVKESGGNLKPKAEETFDKYMEGNGYKPRRRLLSPYLLNSLSTVHSAFEEKKKQEVKTPSVEKRGRKNRRVKNVKERTRKKRRRQRKKRGKRRKNTWKRTYLVKKLNNGIFARTFL